MCAWLQFEVDMLKWDNARMSQELAIERMKNIKVSGLARRTLCQSAVFLATWYADNKLV